MKKTIATLLILAHASPLIAGNKIKSDAEWMNLKYKQLAAVKNVAKVKHVGLTDPGDKGADGLYTYFPKGNGRIVFVDKSWVLLVSHSLHAEDGLGDLTLVRASDGKYYVNKGHVCSKLILETKGEITSLRTFLNAKGKGPKAEPISWEKYEGEQPAAQVQSEGAPSD